MNNKIIWAIIVVVIIGLGGWYFYSKNAGSKIEIESDSLANSSMPVPGVGSEAVREMVVGAGEVKEFVVSGKSFSFSPTTITVNKGDRVKITLKNTGGFHDLRIEGYDVGTPKIQENQEASFEFTAGKAGSFEYYCSVGNHRTMGMKGALVVK